MFLSTFNISTLPSFPKYAQIKIFLIDGQDDNGLGLHLLTVGSNSQERGADLEDQQLCAGGEEVQMPTRGSSRQKQHNAGQPLLASRAPTTASDERPGRLR